MRGDVWIGDLVEAVRRLEPRDQAATVVARALGFDLWVEREPEPTGQPRAARLVRERHARRPAWERPLPTGTEATPEPTLLEPVDHVEHSERIGWLPQTGPGIEPYAGRREHRPYLPLFEPAWSRSIIAAMVATEREIGAVDEHRLVDVAARCEPIRRLPRRLGWSMSRPVQVLVDVGPGMDPFARDQAELLLQLRAIASATHVSELHFTGTPLDDTVDLESGVRGWRPPERGCPVLVLSDFGVASGRKSLAHRSGWTRLAARLAAQDSPTVALIPYPRSRWPRALPGSITAIEWDRPTVFGKIRALRGNERR